MAWTAKAEDPEQGAWVEYADYAALAAENERLRKEIKDHKKWNNALFGELCRMKVDELREEQAE